VDRKQHQTAGRHVYDAGCGALVLYQREIAYAISDPEIKRVTLVKPMRVGFTTLLTGAIGNFVANEEAPSLVTQVRGFELAAVGVAK
jgi:phage terminase large subunit GpA-like protein